MTRYLVGLPVITLLFWLGGAYIQWDWAWFATIERSESRAAVLFTYLVWLCLSMSCPFIFPWKEDRL